MPENDQKVEPKEEEVKIRELTINIRDKVLRAPLNRRAKKAIKSLRETIGRIIKGKEVKISARLNEFVWSRGIKKPPTKISVKIIEKENEAYVDINK